MCSKWSNCTAESLDYFAPLFAAGILISAEMSTVPRARRALRAAGVCELAASAPWLAWIVVQRFAGQ